MAKYFVTTIAPNGFIVEKNGNHKINLSACLDIDLALLVRGENETAEVYAERFEKFYIEFENLHNQFTYEKIKISMSNDKGEIKQIKNIQISGYCPSTKFDSKLSNEIRGNLWEEIFFTKITQRAIDRFGNYSSMLNGATKKKIGSFTQISKNDKITAINHINESLKHLNGHVDNTNDLDTFLKDAKKIGQAKRIVSKNKSDIFYNELYHNYSDYNDAYAKSAIDDIKVENSMKLLKLKEQNIRMHQTLYIEPEEFINTFNMINKNLVLKRLMGFIVDVQIEVSFIDSESFTAVIANAGWCNLKTQIDRIDLPPNKYAYLIADPKKDGYIKDPSKNHFKNTVLNGSEMIVDASNRYKAIELLSFDKVAQEQKIKEQKEKIKKGDDVTITEQIDSFTRGVIVYHHKLEDMIASVEYERGTDNSINEGKILNDDYFVHGHRVAVLNKSDDFTKLQSITKRSITILDQDDNKIFFCPSAEACIHFDAVIHTSNDKGQTEYTTSGTMFEWNGQQLTLKSAFSKSSKVRVLQKELDKYNNPDSSGIEMSQIKCEEHLFVDSFPFKKIVYSKEQKKPDIRLLYGLPGGKIPKLTFGNEYKFVIYQEYKNGWGLPLHNEKDNPSQISVSDLVGKNLTTDSILFHPLENKKPVLLFHSNPVKEETNGLDSNGMITETIPMSEKDSLEHLVIRSDNADDNWQSSTKRHILPERISMEHAFWHDLLFSKMSFGKTLEWKRKYNCEFHTEKKYDEFVNKKEGNKCTEGCSGYCGGTAMEDHYTNSHISPNFFTDPDIQGFTIQLFWDKECKFPIPTRNYKPEEMIYGGTPGVNPKSYSLKLKGSSEEAYIENHDWKGKLEIYLKKGMNVYAEITNSIDNVNKEKIRYVWCYKNKYSASHYSMDFKDDDDESLLKYRNPPKIISLTYAVKEPLVIPKIIDMQSTTNSHNEIDHINEWLKKDYSNYKLGKNIIASRINNIDSNSCSINMSHAKIELKSHFERLDAIRRIEFLNDVIPTGSLEIWMRKEEFIDNPEQMVLSRQYNSLTNHFPDEPVIPFSNKKNQFSLEHKIEFDNEIMQQLKNYFENVEEIGTTTDVFRSLITKLSLNYDLKSTKFEEREYYLKNASKFRGFFTNQKINSNEELEEYVLPKINDVMKHLDSDSGLRFKVMTLNNMQPAKPEVAYAITTIQEIRSYPERKKTIATQKGNIVTIYLKRGRLSSGKDERVGLMIDALGGYNELLKVNDLLSKVGKDVVSDMSSGTSKYIEVDNITIPDNNEYMATFDESLKMYHFLPKFDIDKQLWKFEIELNIKNSDGNQMHNPFVNLCLVHFQPFSHNYSQGKNSSMFDLRQDCRISDIENSVWCYLLPKRHLSVYFDKPNWIFDKYGEVDLTVAYDYESLHHSSNLDKSLITRSNFIVTVEGSNDGLVWNAVGSWLDNNKKEIDAKSLKYHHPLLSYELLLREENLARLKLKFTKWAQPKEKENSQHYSKFRVQFIEVEWFSNQTWEDVIEKHEKLINPKILDNEDMRIRYVELIY